MFLIEWFVGYFGANSLNLIIYLTWLILSFSLYIIGLSSEWKLKTLVSFFIVSISGIISNISDINNMYIIGIAIFGVIFTIFIIPQKEIKFKIVSNIISLFFVFLVFITGLFIIIESTTYEAVSKIEKKI